MELTALGISDVGKKRSHNEDSILIDDQLRLYIVADGMGGHAAGEVASKIAIDVIQSAIRSQSALIGSYHRDGPPKIREQILKMIEEVVQNACAAVFHKGQEDQQQHGMGTTLSLIEVMDSGAFIAHVGDSRIYLLREGQVHQLTEDHTLVNEQLKHGAISKEEAVRAKYKNVITRALGTQEKVRVDTLHLDILPADTFIICSDGLHGYLKPGDIEHITKTYSPNEVPQRFVELANQRGGRDNISVITLNVLEDEKEAAEELRQRLSILQQTTLFRYLNYRELVNFMNLAYFKTVREGETIIEENVVGDEMFLLVQGEVRVLKGGQEIARLPHGSHFGEMALIDNSPRSATIKAIGPARLLVLDRNKFYDYIRSDATAGVKLLWSFLQVLTTRLRSTDEKLREVQEELSVQEVKPEWLKSED